MGTEVIGGSLRDLEKYHDEVEETKAMLKTLKFKSGKRCIWLTDDIDNWIKETISEIRSDIEN